MPIVVIDLDVLVMGRIDNGADIDIGGFLGRKRWRYVCEAAIAKDICVPTLGLVGDLLAGPLPLLGVDGVVILAVGRERSRGGSVKGRICAVGGYS